MKKNIIKLFLAANLLFSISTYTSETANQDTPLSQTEYQELLNIQREILENLINSVRTQTNKLGSCIQQIIQVIQNDKLQSTESQKAESVQQLQELLKFTNLMLKNLTQINPAIIQEVTVYNTAMTEFLLECIQSNILAINTNQLTQKIELLFNSFDPEHIDQFLYKNDKMLDELSSRADSLGLSWYNKPYRYLKKKGAYSFVKNSAILTTTALGIYMTYRAFNPNSGEPANGIVGKLDSVIDAVVGTPGKAILDDMGNYQPDPNNPSQLLTAPSSGLHKLAAFGGLGGYFTQYLFNKVTDDLKPYEAAKKVFTPWYNSFTLSTEKGLNSLDEFLQGSSNNKLFWGDYEDINFKNMVGAEELEELAKRVTNYMMHPEQYERSGIEERRGILLYGPPQTGKTLFAKALRSMIQESFGNDQKMHFIDVNYMMDVHNYTVEYCFYIAQQNAPCILFFDEVDLTGGHREKSPITTKQLLAGMNGIDTSNKNVIAIAATNRIEQIDKALLKNGRFGKQISIGYPKYKQRQMFLEQQVIKKGIDISPEYIDHIAQETDGCSYNDLKCVIDTAMINSNMQLQAASEKHFEQALDSEIRNIKSSNNMSPAEKEIVATYQAGKALTRHLLQTNNTVVKVTINNVEKNIKAMDMIAIKTEKDSHNDKMASLSTEHEIKYGEVFTKATSDYTPLLSKTERENECISLLAGHAALRLFFNDSFPDCNEQDRANSMQIIKKQVSQGESITEAMEAKALEIKDQYEQKALDLLSNHKELLNEIVKTLIEQNTIDRYQWNDLVG